MNIQPPTGPPAPVEVPEHLTDLVDALRALGATGPAVTADLLEVAPVREYLTGGERQSLGLLVLASRITEPESRRAAQRVALRLVEGIPAPHGPLVPAEIAKSDDVYEREPQPGHGAPHQRGLRHGGLTDSGTVVPE